MKSKVICVVMGGGRGTRLSPLTKLRCKPAVPLAGKYRLVDIPISNCLNSGLNNIFVLTQFNTASLHRHIQDSYKFDAFAGGFVDIMAAEQTDSGANWYQGTADAVRQNMMHFDLNDGDLVLILSGDQLYRMDFEALIAQHRDTGADVTIAGTLLPKAEVQGLGLMRIQENMAIEEFVEKPTDPSVIAGLVVGDSVKNRVKCPPSGDQCLANMGIYVFNAQALSTALDCQETDFGKEIIPDLLGKKALYAYVYEGYWEDIGTVKAFFDANLRLTDPVPPFNFFDTQNPVYTHARYLPAAKVNGGTFDRVIVSDGSIISKAEIIRSVIGIRSVINEGSKLDHVVMMGADSFETLEEIEEAKAAGIPPMGIGKNCKIKNAILDKNARIGEGVILDPAGKEDLWETEELMVRDGVIIVKKDKTVPSGTKICP
ncbi:MAG: glucose-1-phosphate adenylyltransferase [Opitutales bacterium]|nr:glucose-1-phosphate adenylyltransferase [Opitutales bacterium]